jgi:glutaredoxin
MYEYKAMPDVTIYTTNLCPYCHRAKALLRQKGVAFHEVDVSYDPTERKRRMSVAVMSCMTLKTRAGLIPC